MKPWEQSPKPPRRTAPALLARDRPVGARQPYETLSAYKAFLAYLKHGSIRKAADALGANRSMYERWSKRWRWPERRDRILAQHVARWADLNEFEERHGLEASADADELLDRQLAAFVEVSGPKIDRELERNLRDLEWKLDS